MLNYIEFDALEVSFFEAMSALLIVGISEFSQHLFAKNFEFLTLKNICNFKRKIAKGSFARDVSKETRRILNSQFFMQASIKVG